MAIVVVATRSMKSRSWLTSEHRALVVGDQLLEQVERLDVEVVGRLVEHQQVRLPRHQPRQQQPRPLAARERRDRPPRLRLGEEEVLEVADHVPRLPAHHHLVAAARRVAGQRLPERRLRVERRPVLVEDRRHQVGPEPHPPRVRRAAPRSGCRAASSCRPRSARRAPPARRAPIRSEKSRTISRPPNAFATRSASITSRPDSRPRLERQPRRPRPRRSPPAARRAARRAAAPAPGCACAAPRCPRPPSAPRP